MPVGLRKPEDHPTTESGAPIGSTSQVVEALVNRLLIKKARRQKLQRAQQEASRSPEERKADAEEKLKEDAIDDN